MPPAQAYLHDQKEGDIKCTQYTEVTHNGDSAHNSAKIHSVRAADLPIPGDLVNREDSDGDDSADDEAYRGIFEKVFFDLFCCCHQAPPKHFCSADHNPEDGPTVARRPPFIQTNDATVS